MYSQNSFKWASSHWLWTTRKWARPWENVSYAICEQQRRRSACASAQSDQCLCCSLPRQNDTSSLYIRNFKILAGLCSWADQFASCLVGDSRRHIFSWHGSNIIWIWISNEKFFMSHSYLACEKWDLDKQCRPRSDTAECGICTRSPLFTWNSLISVKSY